MQDRSHFLWMILPILPLLAGFAALHLVNDGTMTLLSDQADTATFHPDARDLRFFNALVPYVALGLFHVAGCTAVTVVALRASCRCPRCRVCAVFRFWACLSPFSSSSTSSRAPRP